MKTNGVSNASIPAVTGPQPAREPARGSHKPEPPPAAVPSISDTAKMFAKLSSLKSSDPERYRSAMQELASHLRAKARAETGRDAQVLNRMADQLLAAAESARGEP